MGFFPKHRPRAFKLLTSTVNCQEMHRAHVCPELIGTGNVFSGKHPAGPDATLRSINPKSTQHPLCAPEFARSQCREGAERAKRQRPPKMLEALQSPRGSVSLLQRPPKGLQLLPMQERKPFACAATFSSCAACPASGRASALRTLHRKS